MATTAISIVGILNVTPDSFSDGGHFYNNIDKAAQRVKEMIAQGADSIDIGGESTRPGSQGVSVEEELRRVLPVIEIVRKELGERFPVSIDTYKASVAEAALEHGATTVNSLGGFTFDPTLATVIAKHKCSIVIYHIKGQPRTMQVGEIKYQDVIGDITQFFRAQIELGLQKGIAKKQFIIDPGIGFGKTVEQNVKIVKRLKEFKKIGLPIMVGVSRKSHLGKLLQQKLNLSKIPVPE